MVATAPQLEPISTDEDCNVSVDFTGLLDSGELLTGTPTVTGSANLTISNEQVNASAIIVNDKSLSAGQAAQFKVSSSTPGRYEIDILCSTDGGQAREGVIELIVKESKH